MTKQPRRAEWPGIHLSPTIPLTPFLPGRGQKKRAGGAPPTAPWQKGCAPLHSPHTPLVVARSARRSNLGRRGWPSAVLQQPPTPLSLRGARDAAIWGGGAGLAWPSATTNPLVVARRASDEAIWGGGRVAGLALSSSNHQPPRHSERSEESTYKRMIRFPFVPHNKSRHTAPLRATLRLNVPVKPYSFPHSFARKLFIKHTKRSGPYGPLLRYALVSVSSLMVSLSNP